MNEVLMQLFVDGPTWDGNLISKSDRDELVQAGFVDRDNGWNFLSLVGVREAVRLSKDAKNWADRRWYEKGYLLK